MTAAKINWLENGCSSKWKNYRLQFLCGQISTTIP
jgi:hypothetical protein